MSKVDNNNLEHNLDNIEDSTIDHGDNVPSKAAKHHKKSAKTCFFLSAIVSSIHIIQIFYIRNISLFTLMLINNIIES